MTAQDTKSGGGAAAKPDRGDEIDPKLLDLLVCPLTKSRLRYDEERSELVCEAAKLAYPVRGGVPIMLPSEARSLD